MAPAFGLTKREQRDGQTQHFQASATYAKDSRFCLRANAGLERTEWVIIVDGF